MPGKQARALCPVCQEPMPPDETECVNCGAFVIDEAVVRLSRAFGIDREKALALFEKGFRHPRQLGGRDVDDVLHGGENGLLFLCTNCGGFVATGDTTCPRCDAEFEVEEPVAPRPERDILDMVLCSVCGADNDPSRDECEICGENLRFVDEPEEPRTAAEPADRPPAAPAVLPDEPGLEKVDAILEDLELPSSAVPHAAAPRDPAPVPRLTRVPKVARPPTPRQPVASASRTHAVPPEPSREARTPRQPPSGATPRAPSWRGTASTPPKPRRRRPRARAPFPLSPESVAALVAASAVGVYIAAAVGQGGIAWGLAGIVVAAAAAGVIEGIPRRGTDLEAIDGGLLAAGAVPGLLALAAPQALAGLLVAAGALPMAWATRRLWRVRERALLASAAGVAVAGYAVAVPLAWSAAMTPAWTFGLAAYAAWPAALVALELRRTRFAAALRRELMRAERDVARHDYDESLRDYDRAIALGQRGAPGEDLPWYGRGATLILLGRYEEALRAIDTALDINPRNEVAWLNKGNALMRLGRHLDALRCFNAALKVNPKFEVAWNNKGNALARMGHFEEALRCYERALSIDPAYRGSWVNKGYVLTKLGRYDEAAACADRAMRISRTRVPAI